MFSFNYNGGSGLQLSNTDYSMFVSLLYFFLSILNDAARCVRMERNFCGIEYTACDDTINPSPQSFSVSGSSNTGSQVKTCPAHVTPYSGQQGEYTYICFMQTASSMTITF